MKYHMLIAPSLFAFFTLLLLSCNKPPYKPDYNEAGGFVIGKETCKANDADEYWLVDLTVYPNTPQYGDSLTLNGTTHTNVVKLKGLDPRLMQIGVRVAIDFKIVTPNKVITSGCSVVNPTTYALKELFIINQAEIR